MACDDHIEARVNCNYVQIEAAKDGLALYRCDRCQHQRKSRYPASSLHRNCPAATEAKRVETNENLASIQANGPERTDNEVLTIITNFCNPRDCWNPKAEKKKCKYCGCGSTDTVENLHRRRIRNCPKGHWTEASLQRYLHPEVPADPLAPSTSTPKKEPCTVCGKPSTTICGYTTIAMCGAPLCDTCTHPHRL